MKKKLFGVARWSHIFPIEVPLVHEKNFSILSSLERILKVFFESCAPDVVPAGAFWELEI